ncbi:protein mono-ADP-ribosyltransferase PARP11-like [Saccoglossus kowalevskii]|uniref:Poly [ADP-ribose] polymerase n=1 Tax=Saccoglossus kowalevskii TaxID=10224 RepID=A0ABM0GRE7_SACKO|nr:PREDICTED: poly [ADP-ribose] polymerase 12-like [Saccoglossus kowalevskii]
MQKWQTRGEVQTQHLFHGTSEKLLNIICRDNFNWRLSGKITGSKFGKGIYLGTTAKYADSFAESDNLYRKIFLSRVLVGDFVQGDPSYNLPPPRDESDPFGNLYDACVNNELNPCIFVIFDKSQIYPEYVITYMRYDDIH